MINKIIFLILITLNIPSLIGQQLYPIIDEDEQLGYIDINGKVVIEPRFDTKINYVYYIDGKQKYKAVDFQPSTYFSGGVATVRIANRFLIWFILSYDYALIDTAGKLVAVLESAEPFSFSEGMAVTKVPNRYDDSGEFIYRYIGKDGSTQISRGLIYAGPFRDGLALARIRDSRYGYINRAGLTVIPLDFVDASNFSEGLASIKIGPRWGYIDKSKEIVINPAFDRAFEFKSGAARVVTGRKIRYINRSGNYINTESYSFGTDFSEGLAAVKVNGRYGFIDTAGILAIQPIYLSAESFSDGLACVKVRGRWGFIDRNEKFVLRPKYQFALGFVNGIATIWKDGVAYYINKKGEIIWQLLDCRN